MTRQHIRPHCDVDEAHWSRYLDGEFTSTKRLACDAHLATCVDCRRKLRDVRRIVALLNAAAHQPLPRGVRVSARRRARALMRLRNRASSVTSGGTDSSR